ncbi:TetR/AcrR family transcriptional regulator [Streptomyces sp. NBC_01795]|uniref:TetR/AcrR family transcriptional regulator n=1 Tax=unclassified Streptomyces TaxID=2593676 RepID=UPI002DDC3075|nr:MULTISPECIES: TetR/AcrR family transcriptional regulator [unclassified Streptomyces]WSA95008.1 TetR/AcrR family transcriptional regulator [Streptomyces sp. NBC_01795]WSB79429.1 TetR/AcrR family transcriptional regulator [Streptomyces sp. NBC_01775]WSS12367.1 TetR/AcrR family transcriptional regulator [Streptomyces sp. NBC_01186]
MEAETTVETRVLSAADALFYQHGVQAVGMDRIRDASGVSLKRIYQCFPSKGALVEAYLRRRDRWARTALEEHVARHVDSEERLLAVFDWLHDWFEGPDFHGCAFINAFGELGSGSQGVADAVRDHKAAVHQYLSDLVHETGAAEPDGLAAQLVLLLDGAMSTASITDSPAPARQARAAARTLLSGATLMGAGHG